MKSLLKKCTCFIATLLAFSALACGIPKTTAKADTAEEKRYYNEAPLAVTASVETVAFSKRYIENYVTPNGVPFYHSSLSNSCGPVAGAIVVGYYSKYMGWLIPGYTSYDSTTGIYEEMDATYVPSLIQTLYTSMQCNVGEIGVTETNCLNGLRSYVEGQDYSIYYTDLLSTTFDESGYVNAVYSGKPVLIFGDTVDVYSIKLLDSKDEIEFVNTATSHVVVGYGFLKLRYYDANNVNFRTDTYLQVATGWANPTSGYVKVNDIGWMTGAHIVVIN